ncbi:MAG: hypothetical protein V1703_02035 [Candidatus Altiarchaeota archaeon]
MDVTTVKLYYDTKKMLNQFREYRNESYDELMRKVIYIARNLKKNPKLSSKTIREIESARKRLRNGKFYTEKQMAEMLGLD